MRGFRITSRKKHLQIDIRGVLKYLIFLNLVFFDFKTESRLLHGFAASAAHFVPDAFSHSGDRRHTQ